MFRDVFYLGGKPNAHPKEKPAIDLADARKQATTEHFWIINEFCNYVGFDWDWDFYDLPESEFWAENHNNVWPSVHQKDSGTWLCAKKHSDIIIYRNDVKPLRRKPMPEKYWVIPKDLDCSYFDFSWHPDPNDPPFIYEFGVLNTQGGGPRYIVENSTAIKYIDGPSNVYPIIDIFYIDYGNDNSIDQFEILHKRYKNRISRTRFVGSLVDTVNRCVSKSSTTLFWILDSRFDYSTFKFNFYPNNWQMHMVHVIGHQWNKWGTTLLVNRNTFPKLTQYVKVFEHLSDLNFVQNILVKTTSCYNDIYLIDHGNQELFKTYKLLKSQSQVSVTIVPYLSNYLDTFKKIVELSTNKTNLIWITSSICDYTTFDFSYIPDPYEIKQLHVFSSQNQKYGDTFLLNVNEFKLQAENMKTLSDYSEINFIEHLSVKRFNPPVIISDETHVTSLTDNYNYPYALYKTHDNLDINVEDVEPLSLWQDNHKNIIVCSTGATQIIAPKETRKFTKSELYDYPYIVMHSKLGKSKNMEVVFMSNNETGWTNRYEILSSVLGYKPKHINGVIGRENAIRKAVSVADTDWVFVVPGKLEIDRNFDFSWQPDRMQEAKHYIFYATNPLNKLCYGHMAMVLYNKRLVLDTTTFGLDFTMSKNHAVIPINSGVAYYNLDPLMTWRTAFREAVKLKAANDVESLDRLNTWLTVAEGLNSDYSIKGAKHGVEYYDEVSGDADKLQLSFDWDWLKIRYDSKFSSC